MKKTDKYYLQLSLTHNLFPDFEVIVNANGYTYKLMMPTEYTGPGIIDLNRTTDSETTFDITGD